MGEEAWAVAEGANETIEPDLLAIGELEGRLLLPKG